MDQDDQRRRMSDKPAWVTPADQVPFVLIETDLDAFPIGTVLAVPAGFPRAGSPGPILVSVAKVSARKWQVQTRSGFDRKHLVGLSARYRLRRGNDRG